MSVQCHCGSWNHEPRHHPPDDHLVWAEGPPCDENCPGETSQWHDGYAWGTERAEARRYVAAALAKAYREDTDHE